MKIYKKLFLISAIISCIFSFVGCKQTDNVEEIKEYTMETFQLNDKFEIVDFEENNDTFFLTIKSDEDIREYLINLHNNFDFNFYIYLFNKNAKSTDFNGDNIEYLREIISYNSSTRTYEKKQYIILPEIEKADDLLEFVNEKVEKKNNNIEIYLRMNLEEITINELISHLKLYKSFVEKNNEEINDISIIVNDTYVYENNEYVVEKTTEKF